HHNRFSFNDVLTEFNSTQHGSACDPGRGEEAITLHHVLDLIFALRVLDPHLERALTQFFGINDKPGLHLATYATQGRGREHALSRSADPEIDIDTGLQLGTMDHASHVAIADQAHGSTGPSHRRD